MNSRPSGRLPCLLVALFAVLWPASNAVALDPGRTLTQYVQTSWRMEDGLPHNSVRTLLQGRTGYLWLGTFAGLVRFDGVRFVVYDNRNSDLRHNEIRSLAQTPDGTLWVGTNAGGLHRLVNGNLEPVAQTSGNLTINALDVDSAGRLWAGTGGGLLMVAEGRAAPDGWPAPLDAAYINDLHVDDEDSIWIASRQGLYRLRGAQSTAFSIPAPATDDIQSVTRARDRTIWISSNNHVIGLQISAERGRLQITESYPLTEAWGLAPALFEGPDGNMWIGSYGGGLYRLYNGVLERMSAEHGLLDHRPWAITADREGGLWLGTRGGVARLRDGAATTISSEEGLPSRIARTVLEHAGRLWVGTEHGLTEIVAGQPQRSFDASTGLNLGAVRALIPRGENRLWVGGLGGIVVLEIDSGRVLAHFGPQQGLPSHDVRNLLLDDKGRLWAGTERGLAMSPSALSPARFSTPPGMEALATAAIETLYQDSAGAVLIGTRTRGMAQWTDNGAVFPELIEDASIGVRSFYRDAEDNLFVGSIGAGLLVKRPGQSFQRLTTRHGLPDDSIWSILPVGDELWMSSDRGVFALRRSSLLEDGTQLTVAHIFGTEDGMRSRECNGGGAPAAILDAGGQLWYPTADGVVGIDIRALDQARDPPAIVIEDVRVDRVSHSNADPLVISSKSRDIEIAYTGFNFANPAALRFRYRLDGYDSGWVSAGPRRQAFYSNLPPGQYDFVVEASVDGMRWRSAQQPLSIEVQPRFHQTWWFRIAMALGLLIAAQAWLHWRMRRQRHREVELRELVAMRTRELEEANATLMDLAALDSLTGLANHRTFYERLEQAWAECRRSQHSLALLMCDIDDFKAFNDTYGHPAGDRALRRVAEVLERSLQRATDLAARYGGEEFVVLLTDTDARGATAISERIRKHIEALAIENRRARAAPHLTVSIGCAVAHPASGNDSPERLVERSDRALYQAKSAGRNQCVVSTEVSTSTTRG